MQLEFKAVEELFKLRYAMDRPSIAFRGRLQHLQRNEFPDRSINPGKGSKASYGWSQIFQLSVALDLIDVGLSPDAATALVRSSRDSVLMGAASFSAHLSTERLLRAVRSQTCPFNDSVFVVTSAHSLFALGRQEAGFGPTLDICSGKDLIQRLRGEGEFDVSATYIDLGKRVMLTLNHVAFNIDSAALEATVADYQDWATHHVLDS